VQPAEDQQRGAIAAVVVGFRGGPVHQFGELPGLRGGGGIEHRPGVAVFGEGPDPFGEHIHQVSLDLDAATALSAGHRRSRSVPGLAGNPSRQWVPRSPAGDASSC